MLSRLAVLFVLLLTLAGSAAASTPAAMCEGNPNANVCVLTVAANQQILLDIWQDVGTNIISSSSLGLTYTLAACDQATPGVGPQNNDYICHYWARSGANSGTETITASSSHVVSPMWGQALNAQDIDVNVANPVDNHAFSQGTLTSSGCFGSDGKCYDAGNITTAVGHDFIDVAWMPPQCSNFYPFWDRGFFGGTVPLSNESLTGGPNSYLGGCSAAFNVSIPGGVGSTCPCSYADTGPPGTFDVFLNFTTNNFYTNIAVSTVAYKGVPHSSPPHKTQVGSNRSPYGSGVFFGAILPIWLRKEQLL
jgi:hypothetical protein